MIELEQINKYQKIECAGCAYDGKTKCILRPNQRNGRCRTVTSDIIHGAVYNLEVVPRNVIPEVVEPLTEPCEEYI